MSKPKKRVKETVSLGIASMAGLSTMGAMGSVPGMPAQASGVISTAGSGIALLNVGQMAKNAMSITDMMKPEKKKKK